MEGSYIAIYILSAFTGFALFNIIVHYHRLAIRRDSVAAAINLMVEKNVLEWCVATDTVLTDIISHSTPFQIGHGSHIIYEIQTMLVKKTITFDKEGIRKYCFMRMMEIDTDIATYFLENRT